MKKKTLSSHMKIKLTSPSSHWVLDPFQPYLSPEPQHQGNNLPKTASGPIKVIFPYQLDLPKNKVYMNQTHILPQILSPSRA